MKALLALITVFSVLQLASSYDAETEVKKRAANLEKMCQKYSDPKRPESEVTLSNY